MDEIHHRVPNPVRDPFAFLDRVADVLPRNRLAQIADPAGHCHDLTDLVAQVSRTNVQNVPSHRVLYLRLAAGIVQNAILYQEH